MNGLRIEIEWEDPCGARGAELRATWARLCIRVGDSAVTRVDDRDSRSVRESIHVPAYPVAEWIATHWWSLWNEVEAPGTARCQTFAQRHSLASGREGYAVPDLTIAPRGRETDLRWTAADGAGTRVAFLASGAATAPTQQVQEEICRFVNCVVERLRSERVTDTLLQREWAAIQGSDADERVFCQASGALGLDPYGMAEADRDRLVRVYEALPPALCEEFLLSVDFDHIELAAKDVNQCAARLRRSAVKLQGMARVRAKPPRPNLGLPPWQRGYEFARALRGELGLNGRALKDNNAIADALGVPESDLRRAIVTWRTPCFDALVASDESGCPNFALAKRREESTRFAFCRALYEYLVATPADALALVSTARSDRQRANRAFAAEFLVPAAHLRERIEASVVDEERLEDLAAEFGVSSWVVRHQIENHRLASVSAAC